MVNQPGKGKRVTGKNLGRHVKELMVVDATDDPVTPLPLVSDGTGSYSATLIITSRGARIPRIRLNEDNDGLLLDSVWKFYPHLDWLNSESERWQQFRITNAVVVFVPVLGANAIGSLKFQSVPSVPARVQNPFVGSTRTAVGRNSDFRYQLLIDSSWKFCAYMTTFASQEDSTLTNNFSLSEISVSELVVTGNGINPNTAFGQFYVEYDVEFKLPVM